MEMEEDLEPDTKGRDLDYSSKDVERLNNGLEFYSYAPPCLTCNCVLEQGTLRVTQSLMGSPSPVLTCLTQAAMMCKDQIELATCHMQCAFRGAKADDNRIAVSIHIEGREYTALLDTGCTSTSIDPKVAKELNLETEILKDLPTFLTNKKHKVETTSTKNKIDLKCNGRSLHAFVDVLELDHYDCYIGMDLFYAFGFKLEGMYKNLPSPRELYVLEDKDKPSIVAFPRPSHECTIEFMAQQTKFKEDLAPDLAENAAIDPKSFCPHPFMKVELKVKEGTVILQTSSRPFAQSQLKAVDKQIAQWKEDGVIVLAPYGTQHMNKLTGVERKDNEGNIAKFRICLDPRNLNNLLEDTDHFLLPLIADILEKTAGHKYFTTLDLRQAYHQLPLSKESQPYTAFMHGGQQYMFARAPFGLKPMTSIFQRGMSVILGDLPFVAVYVDDIVIFSDTPEEHLRHVQLVLDRLTQAKLIINPEKCHFFCTEVVLLGFVINEHGHRIQTEKIANIQRWAPPTNGKMVQRYLGMFNYF